jgi:hypothetical protein
MNTRNFWLASAVALVVLSVWKRKEIAVTASGIARGLRNNNPGNIERGDAWQGLRPTQTDSRFAQFVEMRYGVRAALIIFRNYQSKYGLKTIAQMIARWAPPTENDTNAYVSAVAQRVGIPSNAPLNLADVRTATNFLRAVFRHENGIAAELISDTEVTEGIRLA